MRSHSDPGPLPCARRRHRLRARHPALALDRTRASSPPSGSRASISTGSQRFDPKLRCVITLTRDLALTQAKQADAEIAAGHYRGPLHGIPWGGKDLLDTAGIPTTYGAEPFRNRVPKEDAAVVQRLHDAGAVLVAKLSLGALALNDIWFGGQTMNPWLLEEGASGGSSAGPGAATAAGLVGFSIGSETGGSIVSPSMRCGITGLRPTYGRVPRTGAMTLCWSLDKLGPMTRSVEDAMLVLQRHLRPRPRRRGQRAQPPRFRRRRPRQRPARRLLPAVDEGDRPPPTSTAPRSRPCEETRHDSRRGPASRLALRFAEPDPVRRSARRLSRNSRSAAA